MNRIGSRRIFISDAYDVSARAYFKFAGITNPGERNLANQLIVRMKSAGLWSLFDRLYLMSPTSEFAALTCCKSLTQMSKSGTVSFSSTGLTPNAGTAYLDTNFSISTSSPKVSSNGDNTLGVWIPSFAAGVAVALNSYYIMGTGVASIRSILGLLADISEYAPLTNGYSAAAFAASSLLPGLSFSGHFTSAINSTNYRAIYKDGALLAQNTTLRIVSSSDFPNHYLGATNNAGTPDYGAATTPPTFAGAYISKRLTDQNVAFWHAIFLDYQKGLGRV